MSKITQINIFEVSSENEDEFLALWDEPAGEIKNKTGFISSKLYKTTLSKSKFQYVSISEWQSLDDLHKAFADEQPNKTRPCFTCYSSVYQVIRAVSQ